MIKSLILALLLANPAFAQSQADVVQGNLLPGWRMSNGHYMAAVDLQLAPEWKTYWRAPGDAGIPPTFDWAGSTNLKSVQFHWPSPKVLSLNGMMTIGYLDELLLPVEVIPADPTKPVVLALNMNLGVCHTVCMPAHLTLSEDLTGAGTKDARITAALAAGPVQAKGASASCKVEPIADGLRLTARIDLAQQGNAETVVFETPDPSVWVSESKSHREGPVLVSETDLVPSSGAPFALDRAGVTVTVLAPDHSVELHGCSAP
jgi:DsbC/DsbD-like thiol-disulfide interchange protein